MKKAALMNVQVDRRMARRTGELDLEP